MSSYTAMRLDALRMALAECQDVRAHESFDDRLRKLAAYLIGRFA